MKNTESKPLSFVIFILLSSLVFLRPFFSGLAYPIFESYYEIFIIFLAILVIVIRRRCLKLPYSYIFPILLLLSGCIISTIFSINMQNSVRETIKFISCISILFIISQADDMQKNVLIKTIVIAAAVISVYSIYQYFWGYQHTIDFLKKTNDDFLLNSPYARDILLQKRAIGTFPSPNILAGYLIMAFFLSLTHIQAHRLPSLACAPIIAIALILTKSLGAYLSLIIALIMLFFLSYKNIKKHKLIAAICFIFISLGIVFIVSSKWGRLMNLDNPHNPITQRLNYWRISMAAIKDHPFLGIGPGNFQEVFLRYKVGWSIDTRYSHNIFLQTWLETGIIGLIAIGYLIIAFIKTSLRKSKYILLAGFAFVLHNLVDITYFMPEVGLFWWVLLALP